MNILTVGDISFRGRWENHPENLPFQRVRNQFEQYCFIVANLESPLVPNSFAPIAGKCTLRGDIGWAKILKSYGIALVSLANNHLMDYGEEGLRTTIESLELEGIQHVGAGRDADAARAPVIQELSGKKIAFLARSAVEVSSPCYAGTAKPGVALLDENELVTVIKGLKSRVDYVIVMLHWGIEHYHYPTSQQRRLAKVLAHAGADIILGHHPHVLQGEERVASCLISYSSGNFLFDEFPWSYLDEDGQERMTLSTLTTANREGMMLELSIENSAEIATRQIFTRITRDATVELDDSPLRKKTYQRLCDRLHMPFYDTFWKMYSLKREWDLRLKKQYAPRTVLTKIHKIRPRHFSELVMKIKRSSRISSGKSTNPYE